MYSAFDLKHRRYLSTGRNSRSYEDCLEAVKSLMSLYYSEELDDLPDEKLLKLFKVRIDKHISRVDNGMAALLANIIAQYDESPSSVKSAMKSKNI